MEQIEEVKLVKPHYLDISSNLNAYTNSRGYGAAGFDQKVNEEDLRPGMIATVVRAKRFFFNEGSENEAFKVKVHYVVQEFGQSFAIFGTALDVEGPQHGTDGFFNLGLIAKLEEPEGLEHKPVILKCLSQVKRDEYKKEKGFDPAHFTPGTRCKVVWEDEGFVDITVRAVEKQGPDSYCILTGAVDTIDGDAYEEAYHTGYVKEVYEQGRAPLLMINNMNDFTTSSKIHRNDVLPHKGKSNQYVADSCEWLVASIAAQFLKYDQTFNWYGLSSYMQQIGVVKAVYVGDNNPEVSWVYTANKKKLKRAVKRSLNQFLRNPKEQQQVVDNEMKIMSRLY